MLYRSVFLLLAACLISVSGFAQNKELRSILAAKDDTLKVQDLGRYAKSIINTKPDSALVLYQRIIRISKKIGYPYWIGQAWLNIGFINNQKADDRQALKNYETAIPYFKKAKRIDQVAACLLNMGSCLERGGDTQGAVRSTQQAIDLLEDTPHRQMLANCYKALAVYFFNLDKYAKAATYFKLSLSIGKQLEDPELMVYNLYGIANCYAETKQFDKAYQFSEEALEIAETSKDHYLLMLAHTSLSELYIHRKESGPTIRHSKALLQHAEATTNIHYKIMAFIHLSEGYSFKNDQRNRVINLEKALTIARAKGVVVQLDDIYNRLSDASLKLNDPRRALTYYKKYIFYKDSANNLESNRAVSELDIRYKTAQKDKALAERQLQLARKNIQLEKSRRQLIYSVSAAIIGFLLALLLLLFYKNKRRLHVRQLEKVRQDNEIQLLQALMQGEERERNRIARDLHDSVAGMLAAVKMHLGSVNGQHQKVKEEPGYIQAVSLLDEASSEVRKTAHNLMPEVLLQFGLDEALRRYCNNISNENALMIQYDSWGEIERYMGTFELSVYRIVQELLNNTIKHSDATHALVQLSCNGNALSVTVEDNGKGFNTAEVTAKGMGLVTLQRRVEALNGIFEIDGQAEGGVNAYIEFDVSKFELQFG